MPCLTAERARPRPVTAIVSTAISRLTAISVNDYFAGGATAGAALTREG